MSLEASIPLSFLRSQLITRSLGPWLWNPVSAFTKTLTVVVEVSHTLHSVHPDFAGILRFLLPPEPSSRQQLRLLAVSHGIVSIYQFILWRILMHL